MPQGLDHILSPEPLEFRRLMSRSDARMMFNELYPKLQIKLLRERCKKKEKKLTNVSFMYVCVAGNGEMLVFSCPEQLNR